MIYFDIGEHVVISVEVKLAGVLQNADATYPKVTIYDPDEDEDVAATAMDNDGTGLYHYDYATTGKAAGVYRAKILSVYASRNSIINGVFSLE